MSNNNEVTIAEYKKSIITNEVKQEEIIESFVAATQGYLTPARVREDFRKFATAVSQVEYYEALIEKLEDDRPEEF
jgi:hypothetical protein